MRFPRPTVLSVAVLLLLLPSRPSRGRPLGVRRGADHSGDEEEEEHRKMSKAMVRLQWNPFIVELLAAPLSHAPSHTYCIDIGVKESDRG